MSTIDTTVTGLADEAVADVLAAAEAEREALVDLCAELVAAPSVNPPGDTRQVAGVVERVLQARGLSPRTEATDPLMPSVLAELDSGVPGPHLVLNVHLDTMPAGEESLWTVPPLELTRRDGRLYGLGMGNMKGAVAAMATALCFLEQRRGRWRGRVTFTAVSDEVVFGDNGSAFLLRTHPELTGDALLCGEGPGFRRLALGEKGVLWLRVEARAQGGHSSSVRRGRSASALLASAVLAIDELTGTPVSPPPELAAVLPAQAQDDPAGLLTANVGTIAAGSFVGQVAVDGAAEVDLRLPPGLSAEDAERVVRARVAPLEDVSVSRLKGWDPNWTSPDSALARAFAAASMAVTGSPPTYAVRLPASDASRWRARNVPAVCYGPQPTLSAGVDDYADEDEVVRCVALYTLTALGMLGTSREDRGN